MKSSKITKTHQVFDENDGVWFDRFQAPGVEGSLITAEVPREDRAPNTVRRHLLRKGAVVSAVQDEEALTAAIAFVAPVVRRAARVGWREEHTRFISHGFVAPQALEDSIDPPTCPVVGTTGQLQLAGTLKDWKELVAVAKYSNAMMIALCATFAAPLLALLGRPSFALVLHGPSKIGKSLVQLVAASALGFGRETDLPSLNATSSGLTAGALAFNDHMLPLNEVGTTRGRKSEIYTALRDTTYGLMNGQDTLRHPSWTGAGGGGGARTFQVICLLSSECSPDAWAARNGETRDDGEMARLIGLPVLTAGARTIFNRVPANLTGVARASWEKEHFQVLYETLPDQRGIAFEDFVNYLIATPSTVRRAKYLVSYYDNFVARESMTPVARDIVAKSGVQYGGGILAFDVGVLLLLKKVLARALVRGCKAALAELPDPDAELRGNLLTLREKLGGGRVIDKEGTPPQTAAHDAQRR